MSPQTATDRAEAITQFLSQAGWRDAVQVPLKADASFRRYIRVFKGEKSAMLMDAPPVKEDVSPYISVARFLKRNGFSAPDIMAENSESGFVLSEDLGDDLFTRMLGGKGKEPKADESVLYRAAIELLVEWHTRPGLKKSESNGAFTLNDYNHPEMMREVLLFSEWFLPAVTGVDKAPDLEFSYKRLWEELLKDAQLDMEYFVHRDFHADNLIWLPQRGLAARVGLLDFQDALWGHPAYDLVSLLEDARRDVPEGIAEEAMQHYIKLTQADREAFEKAYALLGAQRNCKIIGIFVRLSKRDGKHHYLSFLPRVWRYLERDLQHPALEPLKQWMDEHVPQQARKELEAK